MTFNKTPHINFATIIMPHLQRGRLAVLMSYITHANTNGDAWLSIDRLIQESGLSRPIVVAARRWLIARGALKKLGSDVRETYRKAGCKLGKVAIYRVTGELVPVEDDPFERTQILLKSKDTELSESDEDTKSKQDLLFEGDEKAESKETELFANDAKLKSKETLLNGVGENVGASSESAKSKDSLPEYLILESPNPQQQQESHARASPNGLAAAEDIFAGSSPDPFSPTRAGELPLAPPPGPYPDGDPLLRLVQAAWEAHLGMFPTRDAGAVRQFVAAHGARLSRGLLDAAFTGLRDRFARRAWNWQNAEMLLLEALEASPSRASPNGRPNRGPSPYHDTPAYRALQAFGIAPGPRDAIIEAGRLPPGWSDLAAYIWASGLAWAREDSARTSVGLLTQKLRNGDPVHQQSYRLLAEATPGVRWSLFQCAQWLQTLDHIPGDAAGILTAYDEAFELDGQVVFSRDEWRAFVAVFTMGRRHHYRWREGALTALRVAWLEGIVAFDEVVA